MSNVIEAIRHAQELSGFERFEPPLESQLIPGVKSLTFLVEDCPYLCSISLTPQDKEWKQITSFSNDIKACYWEEREGEIRLTTMNNRVTHVRYFSQEEEQTVQVIYNGFVTGRTDVYGRLLLSLQ